MWRQNGQTVLRMWIWIALCLLLCNVQGIVAPNELSPQLNGGSVVGLPFQVSALRPLHWRFQDETRNDGESLSSDSKDDIYSPSSLTDDIRGSFLHGDARKQGERFNVIDISQTIATGAAATQDVGGSRNVTMGGMHEKDEHVKDTSEALHLIHSERNFEVEGIIPYPARTVERDGNFSDLLVVPDYPEVQNVCLVDDDCRYRSYICQEGTCVRRPLFPLTWLDLLSTVLVFVCVAFAAGGGIGGGGLLVPLYLIVLDMVPHDAIPLSKATIFGAAVANFVINYDKRHPLAPHRVLIDYEVVMLMEPSTLAGTIIGVYLNKIFPGWLITLLLIFVLGLTSKKTFKNGIKRWKEEEERDKRIMNEVIQYWKFLPSLSSPSLHSAYRAAQKWKKLVENHRMTTVDVHLHRDERTDTEMKEEELLSTDRYSLNIDGEESMACKYIPLNDLRKEDSNVKNVDHVGTVLVEYPQCAFVDSKTKSDILEAIYEEEASIPWRKLALLALVWSYLICSTFLKGGHGTASPVGLECGSVGYWLVVFAVFPILLYVTWLVAQRAMQRCMTLTSLGYKFVQGDVIWTKKNAFRYPLLCLWAGVAAGLLGVGGGMIKGPLLLEMGLLPQVSSATSSFMILFTSSATTVQFTVLGMLPGSYATYYAFVGFCGAYVGQTVLSHLVKRYRKSSLIVFVLAIVIGLSAIIMGMIGLIQVWEQGFDSFSTICEI